MTDTASTPDVSWIVRKLAELQGVHYAVLATPDGLVRARSQNLSADMADRFAATVTGMLATTAAGAGAVEMVAPRQVIAELGDGFLFVRRAPDESVVAVATGPGVNHSAIGYEMHEMAKKLDKPVWGVADRDRP